MPLATNTYDELGRLKTNKKGNLPVTTYNYNVRSWTKSISNTLFTQTLYYNESYGSSTKRYNGNVAAMSWKAGTETLREYNFSYDNLSRLKSANYLVNGLSNSNYSVSSITYDKHGNMLTIQRRGKTNTGYGVIDNLSMTYAGNQLKQVNDSRPVGINMPESGDFKNYSNTTIEYRYNKNGSMIQDLNKGISSIVYNSLNLPRSMDIKSPVAEARNEYIYAADGRKLKVVQKWNPNFSTTPIIGSSIAVSTLTREKKTEYVGNRIFENGVLKRTMVDGGYIEAGTYYFYLNDHLGNNRVVAYGTGTVLQRNHYYPFGMMFGEISDAEQGKQPYKYNEKEYDRMHGLNLYDYTARFMEPALGRFMMIDPLAEKYYSWSPYVYCLNNPINAFDPDGRLVIFINGMYFSDKQAREYWDNIGPSIMEHLNDFNNRYVDGSYGGISSLLSNYSISHRINTGMTIGRIDAENIYKLITDDQGNVKETIKIITHSMGSAFAKGYVRSIIEYLEQRNISRNIIEFEADFAPYQPDQQRPVDGVRTLQFSHSNDYVAGNNPIYGAEYQYTGDDSNQGHGIDTFMEQIRNLPTGNYRVENGKIIRIN